MVRLVGNFLLVNFFRASNKNEKKFVIFKNDEVCDKLHRGFIFNIQYSTTIAKDDD